MSHSCQHDHSHSHERGLGHHHHTPASFSRAFAIGVVLNLGFVLIEAGYGWQVDSLALLADAGHNLADVAGLLLAWAAAWAAGRQADARHTYGWRRGSQLAAFTNSVVLLLAMGGLLWEAAHRLADPLPSNGGVMMAVAAVGVLVNGLSALLFLRGSEHDINLRGAFLHLAADALVSLGVVAAGALYLWQGWAWVDPVMSMVIALVIVLGSWGLLRQSLHLLFDGVPESIDPSTLRTWLAAQPGVVGVHDLHVWAMSTTDIALTAHLEMPAGHPGDAFLHELATVLGKQFGIHHVTVQIEIGDAAGSGPVCAPTLRCAQSAAPLPSPEEHSHEKA